MRSNLIPNANTRPEEFLLIRVINAPNTSRHENALVVSSADTHKLARLFGYDSPLSSDVKSQRYLLKYRRMRLYVFLGYHQPNKLLILHCDDVTSNDVNTFCVSKVVKKIKRVDDFLVVPNLIL